MLPRFADRRAAGRALARRLEELAGTGALADAVVLGLPRGGVVIAAEVAAALGAPLDVVPVRKLGLPGRAELAMGAIALAGGSVETVRTDAVLASSAVDPEVFDAVRRRELIELHRRATVYRAGCAPVPLTGRPVVVCDDGLATGATMRAALAAVRREAPASLVVAVPVGSPRVRDDMAGDVDRVVCLHAPASFRSVGQAYRDFAATADEEVLAALEAARARGGRGPSAV